MKFTLFAVLFSWFFCIGYAQNLELVDSLSSVLQVKELSDSTRVEVLGELMLSSSDPEQIITYANQLLTTNSTSLFYNIKALQLKGAAFRMLGELDSALHFLLKSADKAIETKRDALAAEAFLEIGTTYSTNDDLANALIYENKAITILRRTGMSQELAVTLLNTGYSYYLLGQQDSALAYYNEAEPIFINILSMIGQAYVIGNRSLVHWELGYTQKAKESLEKAIDMLTPLGDKFGIADYLIRLGKMNMEQGQRAIAVRRLKRGMEMALELGLKEQIRDASLLLSRLYAAQGAYNQAYDLHQTYMAYKDSLENVEQTKRMANLRTSFEVAQREDQIALQEAALENQRLQLNTFIAVTLLLIFFVGFISWSYKKVRSSNKLISRQKTELEELNQLKGKLFSVVAHDLKSPVVALQKGQEKLKNSLSKAQPRELMAISEANQQMVDKTYHLLNNTLQWALAQTNQIIHFPTPMKVERVIELVLYDYEEVALVKGITISKSYEAHSLVHVDQNAMKIVFRNLIDNALKFTEKGSITISTCDEENGVMIEIADTGKGIPIELHAKLFDINPEKVKQDIHGNTGTGLGTLLVKTMMDRHNGTIKVVNNAPQGTKFKLWIPAVTETI